MTISKREVVLLAVLLIIVSGTVLYLYLWQPLLAKQASLKLELTQLESTIARLSPWATKETELRSEIDRLKTRIKTATEQKELGIPLPQYLVMVEAAARTSNIKIENTALQITEMGGMSQMNLEGPYQSVYRFLSILEEQSDALVLESLGFKSENNLLKGTLQVRLFSGAIIGETKEGGYPTRSPFSPRR